MKFLVDMPLSPKLVAWLTANGHDAIHTSQAGLSQAEDKEILQHAAVEQRIILALCYSGMVSGQRPNVLND